MKKVNAIACIYLIVHCADLHVSRISLHMPNATASHHYNTTGIKQHTLFNENNEPIHSIIWLSCLAITQANALIPHGQLQPTAAHFLPHPDKPSSKAQAFPGTQPRRRMKRRSGRPAIIY